jgi:signal transduction histidine kinase
MPGIRRSLIGVFATVFCLAYGAAAFASEQKQVLVLYSTRRDSQASILGDRELPRILERGLGESLDYYSEYIDLGRFPEPGYQKAFSDFLRTKYQGHRFDVVVALQDVALEFVANRRNDLFPQTPLVFIASEPPAELPVNSTGILTPLNLAGTVRLATVLQPDLRNVFVITGADERDEVYAAAARAQLKPFESYLTVTHLAGLPTRDLEARLAALPPHSMAYYLIVNRDGAGERFHPLRYVDRLAAAANAPMYSWVDSTLDHGIVGGSLKNLEAQTEAIGELALRVLRGERPDAIAISTPDVNVDQVDWRQLRRWGLSEARVPRDAIVRFKEPSAWDRYRVYIIGAVSIVFAQTALITGLLVQRRRRREAERQVRGRRAALAASYEHIRDLGSRLLMAQDSERARIARELHDDISQQMALLAIDLELLNMPGQAEAEKLASEALDRAQTIAKSLHDLSHRLHPAKLRLIGLVAALHSLQRELARPEIAIEFSHRDVPAALSPELTLCLYRVVQEALQNAIKYARARRVVVHLQGEPDRLLLSVADDGAGFDVDSAWGTGLGLISMRERVEAVGGTLQIRSGRDAGTRIEISVPVATERANPIDSDAPQPRQPA